MHVAFCLLCSCKVLLLCLSLINGYKLLEGIESSSPSRAQRASRPHCMHALRIFIPLIFMSCAWQNANKSLLFGGRIRPLLACVCVCVLFLYGVYFSSVISEKSMGCIRMNGKTNIPENIQEFHGGYFHQANIKNYPKVISFSSSNFIFSNFNFFAYQSNWLTVAVVGGVSDLST